jgi:hypothetical protein
MKTQDLSGMKILSVRPHYEHIVVTFEDPKSKNGWKTTFISSEQLVTILSEFDFIGIEKRTRTWLNLEIDDWRVERFDEPRTY